MQGTLPIKVFVIFVNLRGFVMKDADARLGF